MRRLLFAAFPLVVAATAFVLGSPVLRAQEHEHQGAMAGCACCQKSGTAAENHEVGGGCCAGMAMNHAMAGDHAMAADHAMPADQQMPADHGAMNHAAGGCCEHMAMNHAAAAATPPAVPPASAFAAPGATPGCPTDTAAADTSATGGCCANMKHDKADADVKTDTCCGLADAKKTDDN